MIYHSRNCRYSPLFPHCDCGAEANDEELERLRGIIESIKRLMENAETIVIESSTGTPYTPRMVNVSDLEDVLAGRAS